MPINLSTAETVVSVLKSFTAKQWSVMIFLTSLCIGTAFWVENRYAKIEEINSRFQQSQQQLDSAHFLSLEMFGLLSESQRRQIMEKLEMAKQNKNKSF